MADMVSIKEFIRTIPDFPRPGIMFRDVTTLFCESVPFGSTVAQLAEPFENLGIDKVAGIEARGFVVGGAVADRLGAGFVPIRKQGKLPGPRISQAYTLEYGEEIAEIHDDAVQADEKVLLLDDLLATGGTAEAALRLLERLGAEVVGCAFIVDLPDLGGRALLENLGMRVHCLCEFEGD